MNGTTIMKAAPSCFAHTALLGNADNGGFDYLAKGLPNLTPILQSSEQPHWGTLAKFGAPAALEYAPDTYVEVRALPGAFYDLFNKQSGELKSYAAGTFLFPAQGLPLLFGAFKCFRTWEFDGGELPTIMANELSIASIGRGGELVIFNSKLNKCGNGKTTVHTPFISCLALAYVPYLNRPDDAFARALKSISGVSRLASLGGARARFRDIFGSGSGPVRHEGLMRFFWPENVSDDYDKAVPLKKPGAITKRELLISYDRFHSRFVSIDQHPRR